MTEGEQTKVCRLCAETIKAKAKVCPYCRTRQSRFSLLKGELAGVFFVLVVFLGIPLSLDQILPDESDNRASLAFVIHRHDLTIGQAAWAVAGKNQDYLLTGYVTNNGNYSWRIHELEVRISDAQNNMVDVRHVEFEKAEKFVVQPGQEHAFRIRFESPLLDTNSKLAVRVQRAADGREHYDPD